jgi:signal transduction histidine kinase
MGTNMTYSAEQQIIELKRKLSFQSDVAKAVAHRLNNVLSIILTSCQLATYNLTKLPVIDQELADLLQNILDSTDGAGGLIHQFQRFLNSVESSDSTDDLAKLAY